MIITIQKEQKNQFFFVYEETQKRSSPFEDKSSGCDILINECMFTWSIDPIKVAEVLYNLIANREIPLTIELSNNYFEKDLEVLLEIKELHNTLSQNQNPVYYFKRRIREHLLN